MRGLSLIPRLSMASTENRNSIRSVVQMVYPGMMNTNGQTVPNALTTCNGGQVDLASELCACMSMKKIH